jgi:hypothetical protein
MMPSSLVPVISIRPTAEHRGKYALPAVIPGDFLDVDRAVPDDLSETPSIYGYLRLPQQASDDAITGWSHGMRAYSQAHGFHLVGVFLDGEGGTDSGFWALLDALESSGARDVVVPDIARLHPHPALRRARLSCILDGLCGTVHYCGTASP